MNPWLVACIWALATLDASLMGYRLSMGRSARIAKGRWHRRAALGWLVAVQPAIVAVALLAAVLVARGDPSVADGFDTAMARFSVIGGAYATVILLATALLVVPSVTVRAGASVVVFGPMTLLRPVVVTAALVAALAGNASGPLVAVALLVGVPAVAIEPLVDRRIRRSLEQGTTVARAGIEVYR